MLDIILIILYITLISLHVTLISCLERQGVFPPYLRALFLQN
jgi:hypothetical protein